VVLIVYIESCCHVTERGHGITRSSTRVTDNPQSELLDFVRPKPRNSLVLSRWSKVLLEDDEMTRSAISLLDK
jgi:hypothetical protein